MRRGLAGISTSAVADALREHDPSRLTMRGVHFQAGTGKAIAGPARTLRFLPGRPDVVTGPTMNARMALIDGASPGDVLVMDAMGFGGPVFGDMVGLRAVQVGIVGVVTDGIVRDAATLQDMGLSVHAKQPRRRSFCRQSLPGNMTCQLPAAASS